jgi:hypothetical protein
VYTSYSKMRYSTVYIFNNRVIAPSVTEDRGPKALQGDAGPKAPKSQPLPTCAASAASAAAAGSHKDKGQSNASSAALPAAAALERQTDAGLLSPTDAATVTARHATTSAGTVSSSDCAPGKLPPTPEMMLAEEKVCSHLQSQFVWVLSCKLSQTGTLGGCQTWLTWKDILSTSVIRRAMSV